jgi:hypothetical protein
VSLDNRKLDLLGFDPRAARELFAREGVRGLSMELTVPIRNGSREVARIVQSQWRENLGVNLRLREVEETTWEQNASPDRLCSGFLQGLPWKQRQPNTRRISGSRRVKALNKSGRLYRKNRPVYPIFVKGVPHWLVTDVAYQRSIAAGMTRRRLFPKVRAKTLCALRASVVTSKAWPPRAWRTRATRGWWARWWACSGWRTLVELVKKG